MSYILLLIIVYSILRPEMVILAGPVILVKIHMMENGKQRWREGVEHFGRGRICKWSRVTFCLASILRVTLHLIASQYLFPSQWRGGTWLCSDCFLKHPCAKWAWKLNWGLNTTRWTKRFRGDFCSQILTKSFQILYIWAEIIGSINSHISVCDKYCCRSLQIFLLENPKSLQIIQKHIQSPYSQYLIFCVFLI